MIVNYRVNLAYQTKIVTLGLARNLHHQKQVIKLITVLVNKKTMIAVLTLTVMWVYTVVIKSVHSSGRSQKLVSPRFKLVMIVMLTQNAPTGQCAMKVYAC